MVWETGVECGEVGLTRECDKAGYGEDGGRGVNQSCDSVTDGVKY